MENLRLIRERAGLTQVEAASRAGITQQYYSHVERGSRGKQLPVQTAKRIASVLGFPWTQFYENEGGDHHAANEND